MHPIGMAAETVRLTVHQTFFAGTAGRLAAAPGTESLGPPWGSYSPLSPADFFLPVAHAIVALLLTRRFLAVLSQIFLTASHARLRYWGAMFLYLLILVLGSVPGARADIDEVASGLVLHSCAYAGLAFLVFTGGRGSPAWRAVKAVLTIALMGALDEVVQSFFPYRHAAVSDWLVDCNAALLASLFMWGLWTRFKVVPA